MLDPTPLLDIARAGRPWHTNPCPHCTPTSARCVTHGQIADLLGVTTRTIVRWVNEGHRIDPRHADRYAVRVGHTDYNIWPHLLEEAIEQAAVTCGHCANPFIPHHPQQRYCRPACKVSAEIARRPRRSVTGTKPCAWCGHEFHSTRANHDHCSTNCYRAAYYARNGDSERAYQRDYNAHRRAAERARRQAA